MILKRVRVSLSTMALLIAGCGSGANPPQTAATQDAKAAMRIEHAYVGDGNSSNVYVYEIGSKKLSRTISEGINEPFDVAFDTSNNLYVLNFGNDTVTIYAENDGRPKLTISAGIRWPIGLALDNTNGLYVLNNYNKTITVYNRKSGRERYSISSGLSYPVAIAIGPDQNLYVANGTNIAVYAPGTQTPTRTIATGIIDAEGLAFDSAGNLFVANSKNVIVYPPGSDTPSETLKKNSYRLGFDARDNLYVLGGTLTVFTPAGRELRTYTQGLGRTESMHVAPSGDVYVGAKTQVSVFTPKVPDQPAFYIEHRPYVHAVAFGP
jgi:streptogramin lyase